MEFDYKLALMLLGTLIAGVNYTLYIRSTLAGKFKPHMFTWGIWGLLNTVAFAAQLHEDAGWGMWQTGFMTIGVYCITIAAFFKDDKEYTRSDWTCLFFSLLAIPLWLATDDPVWAVILITIINVIATVPTIRKSWVRPEEESPRQFFIGALICTLSVLSLSVFNLTTLLYMGFIALSNFLIAVMVLWRRTVIKND